MRHPLNNPICCWPVGLVALSLFALMAEAAAPPVVRDHRAQPVVRDHRNEPQVRDHRGKTDPALLAAIAKAVNAARNGPEVKKLKVAGHEFNVKKATVEGTFDAATVSGQISHCLTARPDDQVYYTIKKSRGQVTSVDVRIARGGLAKYVAYAGKFAQKYVNSAIPAGDIESFLRDLGREIDGSWESSADLIVANVALRIGPRRTAGDGRVDPQSPVASGDPPTVRDHRTESTQVRDHRR